MYTYRLSSNLTNPESPEWEKLVQMSLGGDVHEERKRGFLLSREALKQALQERGIDIPVGQLTLVHYHALQGFPQLTISLSHTKLCGAAIVASRNEYRSVGIDIEEESRTVKDAIRERIAHPGDANFRNIEVWCAKEAVFKVLMNTGLFEKPLEFGSIQLTHGKWFHSPSKLEGEWKLDLVSPFVVALAFLKN